MNIERKCPIGKEEASVDSALTHFAMVHLQLSPNEWKKIDKAGAAVQKEWDQLAALPAWGTKGVQEYFVVAERASRTGKTIYFCRLFPLCHIKHSELSPEHHVHKGRVVLGGNNNRDEHGVQAAFKNKAHLVRVWFIQNSWMLSLGYLVMQANTVILKRLTPKLS